MVLLFCLIFWLTSLLLPRPVQAYIEPASGQYFSQWLILLPLSLLLAWKLRPRFHYLSLLLFSLTPGLFLFSHNLGQVSLLQLGLIIFGSLVLAGYAYFRFRTTFCRANRDQAYLATVISLWLFFSFGHAYVLAKGFILDELSPSINVYLLGISSFLFFVSLWLIYRKKLNLQKTTAFFISLSLLFFIFNLVGLAINYYLFRQKAVTKIAVDKNLPDIYYLIFDEYGRADVLKDYYDFDNQELMRFFQQEGFYVASQSQANYPITFSSLASSLNLQYLDYLAQQPPWFRKNRLVYHQMIDNNQVVQFLRQKGYQIIDLSNKGWGPLASGSKFADRDIVSSDPNEFLRIFLKTTALNPIMTMESFKQYLPSFLKYDQFQLPIKTFRELDLISHWEQPTFTFVHVFLPHGPYRFDRYGSPILDDIAFNQHLYLEQLQYVNTRIKEIVRKILANSSQPPIIVIQSDTGPSKFLATGAKFENLTPDQIKERLGILNVYYLPGDGQKLLYPSISPVNSFRLIFNYYFGADYPLLEDKHYFMNYQDLYQFHLLNSQL